MSDSAYHPCPSTPYVVRVFGGVVEDNESDCVVDAHFLSPGPDELSSS